MNKTFACNVNAGFERLVMSFELDTPMSDVSGLEYVITIRSSSPTLPPWWDFKNLGSCRQTSLTFLNGSQVPSLNCPDWGTSQQAAGIAAYNITAEGPGSAKIIAASAVPVSDIGTLQAATEYLAGALQIAHTNLDLHHPPLTCSGCDVPVCIVFSALTVDTQVNGIARLLNQGTSSNSPIAGWQNGDAVNVVNDCPGTFSCHTQFTCTLAPTPTRSPTWGAVKALYR